MRQQAHRYPFHVNLPFVTPLQITSQIKLRIFWATVEVDTTFSQWFIKSLLKRCQRTQKWSLGFRVSCWSICISVPAWFTNATQPTRVEPARLSWKRFCVQEEFQDEEPFHLFAATFSRGPGRLENQPNIEFNCILCHGYCGYDWEKFTVLPVVWVRELNSRSRSAAPEGAEILGTAKGLPLAHVAKRENAIREDPGASQYPLRCTREPLQGLDA
jgi:hypothetical protein